MSTILTIILAVFVFSLLIIVHELGHFVAPKKSGVRVNEFWLGMGPVLLSKTYKETRYCLRAFPIGGAVIMEGEDEESPHADSFGKAKIGKRALIVVAGALMNFVLGFVILYTLVLPAENIVTTKVDSVAEGFLYGGESGIQPGDSILKINGYAILLPGDVSTAMAKAAGAPVDMVIRRNGEKLKLEDYGLKTEKYTTDGVESQRLGLNFTSEKANLLNKARYALYESINYGRIIWMSLGDLVTGHVSVNELSGPIGISKVIGKTAQYSLSMMFTFVAYISINLGIMNLLPLPALDGGRLLFIGIEFICRKPVPAKFEGYVHGTGILLLFGLMIYVTFNDVFMLFFK